jgi:hypothetical protein
MQIILDGKTYVAPAPKARMVRKAIEMTEDVNFDNVKAADLDNMIGYMVDLFGKQFSIEEVYDSLDASELIPTLLNCISEVVGTMGAKLSELPNAQPGK